MSSLPLRDALSHAHRHKETDDADPADAADREGGADIFTGDAWIDVIARGEEASRMRVSVVRFAPGARNAWHSHAVGQTPHVTEGIGRIQARGGRRAMEASR